MERSVRHLCAKWAGSKRRLAAQQQAHDHGCFAGIFKAQGMHDMMERLWGAIFDMLLRMSNMFKDRR